MGSINLLNYYLRPTAADGAMATAPLAATQAPGNTATQLPQTAVSTTTAATAVATTPPTTTPLPTPTIPATATISLLGPPDNAVFVSDATISFYWQWPLPLLEGQQLSLYQLTETGETLLGSLLEANVGQGYNVRIPAQLLAETAVSIQWYVKLETANQDTLSSSEIRHINLITP